MKIITPKILEQIGILINNSPQIIAGYLFGSRAVGKPTVKNDIDLGFLYLSKKEVNILALATEVSKLFSPLEADVLINDLEDSPLLLAEIMKGKVIYQKNVDERALLERRIVWLYDDYLHLAKIRNYYAYPNSRLCQSGL